MKSNAIVALIVACAATACGPPVNTIHVAPTASPDSVRITISGVDGSIPPQNPVYGLSVVRCESQEPYWTIAAGGGRLLPDTVHYGQTVPGFHVTTPARPLVPGCYEVLATDAKAVRFRIGPP